MTTPQLSDFDKVVVIPTLYFLRLPIREISSTVNSHNNWNAVESEIMNSVESESQLKQSIICLVLTYLLNHCVIFDCLRDALLA